MNNFLKVFYLRIDYWKYISSPVRQPNSSLLQVLFTTLFLISATLKAQQFNVNHKLYTQADGLSSNVTYDAVEDKNGIIWIGTQKGVTRFDGQYLKPFNRSNNIELDEVQHLFIDNDVLWCFQELGQEYRISLFHTKEEKLLSVQEYLIKALPFEQKEITSLQLLTNGMVFKTRSPDGEKVFSYIPNTGFIQLQIATVNKQILSISNEGDYWVLDKQKQTYLEKVDAAGEVLQRTDSTFFKSNITSKLIEIGEEFVDDDDNLFVKFLTKTQFGFFSVNTAGKCTFEGRRLRSSFDPNILLDFDNLKFHASEGLLSYRLNTDISFYLRNGERLNRRNIKGPNTFNVPVKNRLGKCLISDHFLLFLTNDGICIADYTINLTPIPFKTFLKKEKVATRGLMTANEQLFINATSLYIGNNKSESNYQVMDEDSEGFGIVRDRNNNLWIERRERLIFFDSKTKTQKTYNINASPWTMYEDEKGYIWYNNREGFAKLNPITGEVSTLLNSGFENITDLNIYHFHKKEDGLLLLATNQGLFDFSLEKGVINRYSSKLDDKFYLPANDFRHLYFDEKLKNYWLASNEGLIRWNTTNAKYKVFTFNNFAANTINAVYPDEFGHLWLSTENGIIQFDKSAYKFKTYLKDDGISHHEFNRISHFQDSDGTIYFGGLAGVTAFHPRDFKNNLREIKNPEISVLELSQYLGKTNNIENVTAAFYNRNEVIVEPNDGYFTLKIAITDYDLFSKVQLLYKLQNSEKWESAENNEITIRKLSYGEYTLQVKALGESGQFTEDYLEVPILIKKPLYLQWWFWVLTLLFLASAITLFVKWRTREFKKQNLALEQEVAKRTAQIEEDKAIIEQQAEKLMELDKTKSKFFANVSHELRTPITLIKGPIQSVLKSNSLDKQNFNLLSTAERNTKSLLRMVNEILDLTKLEASKLALDEQPVLFYVCVNKIVSNFDSIAAVQDIDFSIDYTLDKSLQIQLDEAKFEKVLNNLLSNAFKFTPQHGEIKVHVSEQKGNLRISVQDNGRGIASDDLPNVFNRFYQAKNNTKAEGGLGIGLALSMEYVQLMNGKLWVESNTEGTNQGSTFYVEIPKKEVGSSTKSNGLLPTAELSVVPDIPAISVAKHKHTVLLVEDNADLRAYVSFLLSPLYHIVVAGNGKEALEKLAVTDCHLILSDVMMPLMDGFELLDTVKSNAVYRNIPFVMLTARAELKDKLKALRIGVDDYLLKPFDETELLVRIKNLLTNYENRLNYFSKSQASEQAKLLSIPEQDKLWLQNLEMLVLRDINNSIFSVDYLVQILDTNRNTFYSKVKTLTGLSPNKYVQLIRLQKAKDLLENSTLSIKEITEKVGFKTPDYFTRLFKKEYGKLPSDYLR